MPRLPKSKRLLVTAEGMHQQAAREFPALWKQMQENSEHLVLTSDDQQDFLGVFYAGYTAGYMNCIGDLQDHGGLTPDLKLQICLPEEDEHGG